MGWTRFPRHGTARSVRVRAACYDVDRRPSRPLESRLERLEPSHDEHPHVPGPSLWPVGFALGVVVLLVGLIVVLVDRRRSARVDRARRSRSSGSRDLTSGTHLAERPRSHAGAPGAPRPRPRRAEPSRDADGRRAYPREKFLEATTLGLGAVIGGLVTCRCSASWCCRRSSTRAKDHDLGPLDDYPEGKLVDRDVHDRPEAGRRLAAHGVRPLQRPARTASRASRSSRTTACTSAARCSRTGRSTPRRRDSRSADVTLIPTIRSPASAARATAASTTPRATAPPARPSARSTATRSRSATGACSSASRTRSPRSRAPGRHAQIYKWNRVPRRARRRPRVLALPDPAARS